MINKGNKAQSAFGNYSVANLKTGESYSELANGLKDLIEEAKDLQVIKIEDVIYSIKFYLGGDLKFLATACGIEAANCEHACTWCKCPKGKCSDMVNH